MMNVSTAQTEQNNIINPVGRRNAGALHTVDYEYLDKDVQPSSFQLMKREAR